MIPGLACATGSSTSPQLALSLCPFQWTQWSLLETAVHLPVVSYHGVHHDVDDDCVQDAYCR